MVQAPLLVPAAFRRLCVETSVKCLSSLLASQPPSGGCVLKPYGDVQLYGNGAAAFRRLCVETVINSNGWNWLGKTTAAFRRLCVETVIRDLSSINLYQPPSGGCVLKRRLMA